MREDNKCPYCSNEMSRGVIYQTGIFGIKWISKEKAGGSILSPLSKGIYLTSSTGQGSVEADYCPVCKKIVIDLEDGL